ncbi:MAG TPA: redox-regulated ATPase YchF [Gaiellales bacterium]|jgi:GTP-binding protein YchF|nr:redox-regulated ATPase YchF [Gaiellales bacterium]
MASVEVGLVGLPNCGKSTVFNALTGGGAAVAPHMFSTVESNHGIAEVRDVRLHDLARLSSSAKVVPATLQVVDIAGLVRGASHGEGLGNQFLGHIRTTDAVLHVLRCFRDETVAHPSGVVDPLEDAETVELELAFADLATIERRAERVAKGVKAGDRDAVAERDVLETLRAELEAGRPARAAGVERPATVDLLTAKPTLYVANVDESGDADEVAVLERFAADHGSRCLALNAKIEAELRELPEEDAAGFLSELGIERPALDRITLAAYAQLDLIPFFTTGPKETRAWTIRRGQNAQAAAGRIHTDLARGFIRAEVIEWDRLLEAGSEAEAKRRGWVRVEGRDYVVKDGDVLNVRFNV